MPVDDTDQYEPSPWDLIADQVEQYLASDGEEAGDLEGVPVVILTTKGRTSGKLRRTPLMRVKDGDRYMVVASMGGAPDHPLWYLNLRDDADVTLQDKGDVYRMRARTVSPEEKAALWPQAVAVWPDYDNYQASTDRDIPLVVLEPR